MFAFTGEKKGNLGTLGNIFGIWDQDLCDTFWIQVVKYTYPSQFSKYSEAWGTGLVPPQDLSLEEFQSSKVSLSL